MIFLKRKQCISHIQGYRVKEITPGNVGDYSWVSLGPPSSSTLIRTISMHYARLMKNILYANDDNVGGKLDRLMVHRNARLALIYHVGAMPINFP